MAHPKVRHFVSLFLRTFRFAAFLDYHFAFAQCPLRLFVYAPLRAGRRNQVRHSRFSQTIRIGEALKIDE